MDLAKLLPILFEGLEVTLQIFALTLILSIPLGVIVALLKMSKIKIVSWVTGVYILIMRGTPLMLQILFIYFAPYFLFRAQTPDRFNAVIIAFAINYAAYFAEIFRGGIQSMPIGQYEAADALGYTKAQTFLRIILPQVVKRVLPSVANEVITLIKDTSLAQVIAVTELFALANKQATGTSSVIPLFVAGVFYFVLNWILTKLFDYIEKKLDYYK
ncbi:MAG: amino acid ABC transporter permease [Lachnospiraceae bacterium]|nr:amino acid ABC transporter permease [Lachnospiraceae bacterium]